MSVIQRRYEVSADVNVRLSALDEEAAAEYWEYIMQRGPWQVQVLCHGQSEYLSRLSRLLNALATSDDALDAWSVEGVASCALAGDLDDFMDYPLAEEILARVFPGLPAADRAYFEEAIASRQFYDAVDAFFSATRATSRAMRVLPGQYAATADDELVARQYQVVVDVEVTQDEIDAETAAERLASFQKDGSLEGVTLEEYVGRQRRLCAALRANGAVLAEWMESDAFLDVAMGGAEELIRPDSCTDIIGPAMARVDADVRAWAEQVCAAEVDMEVFEPLYAATSRQIVGAGLRAVPGAGIGF